MRNALTQNVLDIPRDGISSEVRRVVQVNPETDRRYEAFVAAHSNALIYHHPAWLRVLARENGTEPICLACEDAERQFRGVLAFFSTPGLSFLGGQLTGRRF